MERKITMSARDIDDEIDRNFEYFQTVVSDLLAERLGQFALLKSQKIIDFFKIASLAATAGYKLSPDGMFSVQEVIGTPLDLGFYSHATDEGLARQ
jgi:hypothetical protein